MAGTYAAGSLQSLIKPRFVTYAASGRALSGFIEGQVTTTSLMEPAQFELHYSLNSSASQSVDFWLNQQDKTFRIDLLMGEVRDSGRVISAARKETLLRGYVDAVDVYLDRGTVTVRGRDLSALFMDANLTELYQNMTATDVVRKLAANHGLSVKTGTSTNVNIGRYFGSVKKDDSGANGPTWYTAQKGDNVTTAGSPMRRTAFKTEWDLMVALAHAEDRTLYVVDDVLYFLPKEEASLTYNIKWAGYAEIPGGGRINDRMAISNLHISQNDNKIKQIKVTVKSWSTSRGAVVSSSYTEDSVTVKSGTSGGSTGMREFVFTFSNLTQEQAAAKAKSIYKEMKLLERAITFEQPGDINLTTQHRVVLRGTNSVADQDYFVESITRSLNDSGFTQSVRARNKAALLGQEASEVFTVSRPSQRKKKGSPTDPFYGGS